MGARSQLWVKAHYVIEKTATNQRLCLIDTVPWLYCKSNSTLWCYNHRHPYSRLTIKLVIVNIASPDLRFAYYSFLKSYLSLASDHEGYTAATLACWQDKKILLHISHSVAHPHTHQYKVVVYTLDPRYSNRTPDYTPNHLRYLSFIRNALLVNKVFFWFVELGYLVI